MTRIAVAILGLMAGLLTVPLAAQPAAADTGCPAASGSYAGGAGTAASPWQIASAGDLQKLRDDSITGWDDSFILTSNINMSGCTWTKTIGNRTTAFTGLLDGGGFSISGLTISVAETADAYAGLVGRLASPGKVTRIGFSGDVSASATTGSNKFSYAGGLVGYAQVGSTVSYSYATGSVTAYVSLGTQFSSAYSYAGGLLGRLDGTITDSYATGSASATGGTGEKYMYAGGLIGFSTSSVTRTYSTGAPTATASPFVSLAGGIVGQTNGGTLTGNLWDMTSSGKSNGAGPGTFSGMAGKTTAQMQQFATYDDSAWPIANGWTAFNAPTAVWGICDGSTRAFLLWQYSANPCVSAPGAPTITSVTPAISSASVAFTADDSGGSTILAIQFALDDTTAIDGSTTPGSPLEVTGLNSGTGYTIYLRAVNAQGPSPWSAATAFATMTPPPPAPIPPSAPLDVRAVAGDATVSATWAAPASPGSFAVSTYQVTASPGGRSCLSVSTTCTIDGLTNGVSYTVTVQALSGAGWSPSSTPSNAVTPRREEVATLTIAGSRGSGAERSLITVRGASTGLAGERVTLWLAIGERKASPASATVAVTADGTFVWSRKLNRAAVIYAEAAGVRSNAIRLPAAR